jgi:hypothetical protein
MMTMRRPTILLALPASVCGASVRCLANVETEARFVWITKVLRHELRIAQNRES